MLIIVPDFIEAVGAGGCGVGVRVDRCYYERL